MIDMNEIYDNMHDNTKRIVFTGGGTGGHVYPNVALFDDFKSRGFQIFYIGGKNGSMEKSLIGKLDVPYYEIDTIKLVRSLSLSAIANNLKIPSELSKSTKQANEILKKINPSCVFSKGGFVSLPVVISARKLGIPVFAHESDLTLGLANKISSRLGAAMLKANPHSSFKGDFVGMPLRRCLFSSDKSTALRTLGIWTDKPILLVLGGSSGASALNDAVSKNIETLCKKYFILHVYGKNKTQNITRTNYLGFEYADNIELFYAVADAIVSRAGATAVFEISALEKRALFVPLPKGVSRGDQIYNARLAQEYGAQVLVQDNNFAKNFPSAVDKTFLYTPMKKIANDANGKIADIVCDTLRRGEKCKNKKPSPNGLP